MPLVNRTGSPSRGRGRSITLYASILSQILSLARNVILARLLGPEEFGLGATILLTVSFFDAISNSGANNYLVQAKDDDRALVSSFHTISILRGFITAGLLAAVAWPLAVFYKEDGLQNSFYLVAFSAAIGGFLHGGIRHVQRLNNFKPDSLTQIAADLSGLIAATVVALLTHSHIAVVCALIARAGVQVAASHVLAGSSYALGWSRLHGAQFWRFGWPLLLNAPLLFVSAQADRLFISFELGPEELGLYSAIIVLVMSPTAAVLKWLGTVYLPGLSKEFHQKGELRPVGAVFQYSALMLMTALAIYCGFVCFGGLAVRLLYGARYATSELILCLIGFLQVVRFLRAWPSTLALATGANGGILLSTIVRLIALPLGYAGIVWTGGLPGLVAGFILGEIVALLIGLVIVNRNAGLPTTSGAPPAALLLLGMCGVGALAVWTDRQLWISAALFVASLAVIAPLILMAISVTEAQAYLRKAFRRGA